VVDSSRASRKILGAFNTTFITLIFKDDNPTSFENFKPIFLCDCIHKIISKIIVGRLKGILSKQFFYEQFGFLEGRKIHEAV
jgi:hypothetical protein